MKQCRNCGISGWLGTAATCVVVTLAVAGGPAPAWGRVAVHVTRVGFPTTRGTVVRNAAWAPVVVDVELIDEPAFDGQLQVSQFDGDGDSCVDRVPVHLRQETPSGRFFLYVPANALRARDRFVVELLDAEGSEVQVVSEGVLTHRAEPGQQPSLISDDDVLTLSVSNYPMGRIRELLESADRETYAREIHLGHISPEELPELWIGLEGVDHLVWDDADPEQLTPRQSAALLEWVRHGGTLLLAAVRSAGSLRLSRTWEPVLPADIGDLLVARNLPRTRTALLGAPQVTGELSSALWNPADFPEPVGVVACRARPDADVLAEDTLLRPDGDAVTVHVLTGRREGRGRILFAAVTLRDLFSGDGSPVEFFRRLFRYPLLDDPERGRPQPISLFDHAISPISFSTRASLYLLLASAVSIGYVALATLGTWTFLGARGWRRYSWTAFAVVALVACAVSVAAINSLQGFGISLHQFSLIDLVANDTRASGTVFLGVKTSADRTLDLWLPSDATSAVEPGPTECFLRAVGSSADPAEATASFVNPQQYRLHPAGAVIEKARFRATLKQFEGHWSGRAPGTVTGRVVVGGRTIRPDSFLENRLGVPLERCLLLQTLDEVNERGAPRSRLIYAFELGTLPVNGERVNLADRAYASSTNETPAQVMGRCTLAKAQTGWGTPFSSLVSSFGAGRGRPSGPLRGQAESALMLLSTAGDFDPTADAQMTRHVFGIATWSRDRLRNLDLRNELDPDHVVLLGFAADPGPVRLFYRDGAQNFRTLRPDLRHTWTLYRVRLPVERVSWVPESPAEDALDAEVGEEEE